MRHTEHRIITFLAVLALAGCGNGSVEGEAGDGSICGDGIKDPDEACDDGNRVAGDECNPQCVPTGTLVACVPLLEGSEDNEAKALLPLPDGSFLVGGDMKVDQGAVNHGWVGRFDRAGKQLWFQKVAPLTADYGNFVDLTSDGEEGCWALIADQWWGKLIHLDSSGNIGAIVDIDSAFDLPVIAHTVEFGDTSVWIGGERQGDFWLGRYEVDSDHATTVLLEDHIGYRDTIQALGRSENEIAAAVTVSTSPNFLEDFELIAMTDVLLIRFDLAGNELGRSLSGAEPDSVYARTAMEVASDGQEGWIVGGTLTPIGLFLWGQVWVSRFEPASTWEWRSTNVLTEGGGAWDPDFIARADGVTLTRPT
jgi:cysteine-rich repeat protein